MGKTSTAAPIANAHVAAHIRRTRQRPLSNRQAAVLAYARVRACNGQDFPTDTEIMAMLPRSFRQIANVRECLLALHARGLLVALETRWGRRERIVCK